MPATAAGRRPTAVHRRLAAHQLLRARAGLALLVRALHARVALPAPLPRRRALRGGEEVIGAR
eukprot:scaffold26316_cov60-Phaeocystis_antarctica.AAC.5